MKRRRFRHPARWIAIGILVIAGGLVAVLATRPPAAYTEVWTPLLGKPAPALQGPTVQGGQFDLASLRGKWVVLNFFASWCPPCQQEQPDLVAFAYQHRHSDDVALVGVVFDDAATNARNFMSQAGATWPAVSDPTGRIALDYAVRGPPETFLISPQGVVAVHIDGAVSIDALNGYLDKLQQGAS